MGAIKKVQDIKINLGQIYKVPPAKVLEKVDFGGTMKAPIMKDMLAG